MSARSSSRRKTIIELTGPFAQRANSFLSIAIRGAGRLKCSSHGAGRARPRDRELPFIQPQAMEKVIAIR